MNRTRKNRKKWYLLKNRNWLKLLGIFFLVSTISYTSLLLKPNRKPNVILIMADDMGYECLSSNGSLSYQTPVLDELAEDGIRFTRCFSQPLCTPSRVKIMTGKYNYRNYEKFGYLNPDEITFANVMKEAGYKTCVAGKWQLNGISGEDKVEGWDDVSLPNHFGFDEYCLWQLDQRGSRYANPLIIQNSEYIAGLDDQYGPDIFCDFILDFIEHAKDTPFFVYYPMVLVHDPFVPTPDSREWREKDLRTKRDPGYFRDMVAYADQIVGRIIQKLNEQEIRDNTILIFTADNGTNRRIVSKTVTGDIPGGKGLTLDSGNHVPLIISWPRKIKKGSVEECLIEFSDFFPTLAEVAGAYNQPADGRSFYRLLQGKRYKKRDWVFVHYDPMWSDFLNRQRNRYVRSADHKLYVDGRFYSLSGDPFEENPCDEFSLTDKELEIKMNLQRVLDESPEWK